MGDYTEFKAPAGIQMNGYVGTVNYERGNKIVQFYKRPILNAVKSREAGRPIHDNHDYVKIMTPGETLEIPDRPVRDEDKQKWRPQWEQFCRNQEQIPDGTPIDLLFAADPAAAANMRSRNIHTIEQLADLSADATQNMMGGQMYKNKAQSYLEQANRGVTHHRFQKELEDRDGKIRVLNQTVDMLKTELAQFRTMVAGFGASQGMAAQTQLMGGRPQFPGQMNPNIPIAHQFDAQGAQIAALGRERRGTPNLPRQRVAPVQAEVPYAETEHNFVEPTATGFEPSPLVTTPLKRRGRPPGSKNRPKTETA